MFYIINGIAFICISFVGKFKNKIIFVDDQVQV